MAIATDTPATLYAAFANHAPAIQAALVGGARDLFGALAVIEFVLVIGWLLLQKTDIIDILAAVLRIIIGLGFWYWMLQNWAQYAKAITDSFGMWANSAITAAGGTANMEPMGFLMAGLNVAKHFWDSFSVGHLLTGFLMLVSGLEVVLIMAWLAAEIMLVVIECYLAAYLGTVLMAFGAMGYTRDYAMSQVRYAISVGVKRMTLQMVAGLGEVMITSFATQIEALSGTPSWLDLGTIIAGMNILFIIAWKAPKIAQDMIMGTHLSTPGGIIGTAKTMATMVASVIAGGAGSASAIMAASKLAGQKTSAAKAAGQGPSSIAGKTATAIGKTAGNLASAAASDVGQRLSGARVSRHGYMGFRMASNLNTQRKNP